MSKPTIAGAAIVLAACLSFCQPAVADLSIAVPKFKAGMWAQKTVTTVPGNEPMVDGPNTSCTNPSEVLARNLHQMHKDGCVVKLIELRPASAKYSAMCSTTNHHATPSKNDFQISVESPSANSIEIEMAGPFRSASSLTYTGPCQQ